MTAKRKKTKKQQPKSQANAKREPMATRQPTIEFAPPEVVAEIGFVETLASIQQFGIHPVPQRGIDGYYAVRLYEAKNPAYIWELTESEVTRAFKNGADVVVCINERVISIAPGNPYTLDRPARFCGCAPDSTLCACLEILHCVTPDAGFTQDLADHRTLAQCVDQATNDEQELFTAMENNHAWADGKNIPEPETADSSLADRRTRVMEGCRRCEKLRVTTKLLPVNHGTQETVMDVVVMDHQTRTFATWLYDAHDNRLVPCTAEQYYFATQNTETRIDAFS